MKKFVTYLLLATLIVLSQLQFKDHRFLLVVWVFLGIISALYNCSKRIFLFAFLVELLFGIIYFQFFKTQDAQHVVLILENLGYSKGLLAILVLLFNALTVAFCLLLGSSLSQLFLTYRDKRISQE